jgi:AcrR family transcriptional regulator
VGEAREPGGGPPPPPAGTRASRRLSAADWEQAALDAIAKGGLRAVAVEPLARTLGVTKGSFYAHFRSRRELLDAALARWEQAHLDAFIASARDAHTPRERLRALMALATEAARTQTIQGRLLLESDDPRVRAALKRVTEIRLVRLEGLLRELGAPRDTAERRATLLYATYIGLLQLAREVPERLADEQTLVDEVLRILGDPP